LGVKAGDLSTKRKQKRSHRENTVRCSNCGCKGHNKKRCPKQEGYKFLKTRGLIKEESLFSNNDPSDSDNESESNNDDTKTKQTKLDNDDKKPKAKRRNTQTKWAHSEKSFL
jgi:hypothetical protein